jgi:hypothetical protein
LQFDSFEQGITVPTVATPRKRLKDGTGTPKKESTTPRKKRKLPEEAQNPKREPETPRTTTRIRRERVDYQETGLMEEESEGELFGSM